MKDVVKNVWEKIAENVDFVEKRNFVKESTEASVQGCSGINSQEIPVAESYHCKVVGVMPVILLQWCPPTGGFL